MRAQHTIVAMGLAAALAGCGAAAQKHQSKPQVARASCRGLSDVDRQVAELYAPGNILRVERIQRFQNIRDRRFQVRADTPRLVMSGAKLYVPAERGMTAPYLERVLSCHAASESGGAHPNDPLKAPGVDDVDVETVGPHFRIAITGVNRDADEAIWQRARTFGRSTRVEVRQLAATHSPDAAF